MKVSQLLQERVSSVVYHATSLPQAYSIMKSDEFKLSPTISSSSETSFKRNKDQLYFMSLTRSRQGHFHRSWNVGVMFKLDGDKLNQKYQGTPVDFFGMGRKKDDNELEDRILSPKREIPAWNYIQEITVLILPDRSTAEYEKYVFPIYVMAKKKGIPIRFYENRKDWVLDKKSSALDVERIKEFRTASTRKTSEPSRNRKSVMDEELTFVRGIIELLSKDDINSLSDSTRKVLKTILSSSKSTIVPEFIRKLAVLQKTTIIDRVSKLMRRRRLRNHDDVIEWIVTTYASQYKEYEKQAITRKALERYNKKKVMFDYFNDVLSGSDEYDGRYGTDEKTMFHINDAVVTLDRIGKIKNRQVVDSFGGIDETAMTRYFPFTKDLMY